MVSKINSALVGFVKSEEGASAVEYGLLASLIAAVIIGVLTAMGGKLTNTFTLVSNALK